MLHQKAAALLWILAGAVGCGDRPAVRQASVPSRAVPVERETFRPRPATAERETRPDQRSEPSFELPAFELPDAEGWIRSELRPLRPEDQGFSVAYDHPAGIAVTLYQFTRGRAAIPDDLHSGPNVEEMNLAKSAVHEAVKLGVWRSADELDDGVIVLGKSKQLALWTRFRLVGTGSATSDIYVWSYANRTFKLRCTFPRGDQPEALTELLTAIGNQCRIVGPIAPDQVQP